jgi:hypothetical protein
MDAATPFSRSTQLAQHRSCIVSRVATTVSGPQQHCYGTSRVTFSVRRSVGEVQENADPARCSKLIPMVLRQYSTPFCGAPNDGEQPVASLVQDSAGNLYSTTRFGGNVQNGYCGASGCGTIFELGPAGSWHHLQILHNFAGQRVGAVPDGGLIFDGAGNLYGTTSFGGIGSCNGSNAGCGTVFRLRP